MKLKFWCNRKMNKIESWCCNIRLQFRPASSSIIIPAAWWSKWTISESNILARECAELADVKSELRIDDWSGVVRAVVYSRDVNLWRHLYGFLATAAEIPAWARGCTYTRAPFGGCEGPFPGTMRAKLTLPPQHTVFPTIPTVLRRASFSVVAPVCESVSPYQSLSHVASRSHPCRSPFTPLQQTPGNGIASWRHDNGRGDARRNACSVWSPPVSCTGDKRSASIWRFTSTHPFLSFA